MPGGIRSSVRLIVLVSLVAGLLVPAWITPSRAITIPITLSRTVHTDGSGSLAASFEPTHVAFSWRGPERTGIAYRIWDGGSPSRWRRAPVAHDLEYGDHHFSGVLAVPRPDSVQWRKVGRAREGMSDIVVDGLNTVDGPRRRIVVPATAGAASRGPDIVTRRQWGADESIRRAQGCRPAHFRVQQLFVHHTVGINHDPHPKATMRGIYWYHTVRRGWCDIGYNFVISPDGQIFEGRFARKYSPGETHDGETRDGRAVSGAHVSSYNSGSVGVSLMGNYSEVRPSDKMRRTLVRFLAWEARRHNLKPRAHHSYRNPVTGLTRWLPVIAGHRDAGNTECPGNYVYRSLPAIRKAVAQLVNKKPTVATLSSLQDSIDYGEVVDLSGTLTKKKDGSPLGDRRIVLKRRRAGEDWKTVQTTRTAPAGSFAFTAEPLANGRFKAVFTGARRLQASQSDAISIAVHATVSLEVTGGTPVGDVPHFAPDDQVGLAGEVVPAHPDDHVVVVIKRLEPEGYEIVETFEVELNDLSDFASTWTGSTGTYRARAKFPADDDHSRGLSPEIDFVISDAP